MVGDNEPWDRDGWAADCKCGVCHVCLPAMRPKDRLLDLLPGRGEN